jgi:DnaJ-class molecular chaperone
MTSLQGRGRGDRFVKVKIEVPTDLSSRQRKLLEDFAGTLTGGSGDPEAGSSEEPRERAEEGGLFGRIFGRPPGD